MKDIYILKYQQKRATKLISGFQKLTYVDKTTRLRWDLLHIFKVFKDYNAIHSVLRGKSSESVQRAITGPCLRMRHRPSA